MSYIAVYYTHKGLRNYQQDCIFINGNIIQTNYMEFPKFEVINSKTTLFAVCDGMGGLSHGEKASLFVCEKLKEKLLSIEFSKNWLINTLNYIQNSFLKTDIKNSGTTIAGILLQERKSIVFNIGDSRVYKLSRKGIKYISHDHSVVQELVDEGAITYEEAFHHPYKHIVTFGIGDVFFPEWKEGKKPYIVEDILKEDEYYLICTDGVSDVLKDEDIYKSLAPSPFENVNNFIENIKKHMSDNFSFIIVSIK